MDPLFDTNGLMFWTEREIKARESFKQLFAIEVSKMLKDQNKAWEFIEVDAPLLTPLGLISSAYTNEDVWVQSVAKEDAPLVLRPETTPGSYIYAKHLLTTHSNVKPPFCVWQAGKSFRREQDQVTKNMRLKEFYQQEFQCIFTSDTKNDYHTAVLEPLRKMFARAIPLPTRIVESDRLPNYSLKTMDIEIQNSDKWMEIASISLRTDFPIKAKFGTIEKDLLILEIAIGLDRCVYNLCHEAWPKLEG